MASVPAAAVGVSGTRVPGKSWPQPHSLKLSRASSWDSTRIQGALEASGCWETTTAVRGNPSASPAAPAAESRTIWLMRVSSPRAEARAYCSARLRAAGPTR